MDERTAPSGVPGLRRCRSKRSPETFEDSPDLSPKKARAALAEGPEAFNAYMETYGKHKLQMMGKAGFFAWLKGSGKGSMPAKGKGPDNAGADLDEGNHLRRKATMIKREEHDETNDKKEKKMTKNHEGKEPKKVPSEEEPSDKKKKGKEAEPADEKKSKAKKVAAENEDNEEEIPNKAEAAKKNAKNSDKKVSEDDQEEPSDKKRKGKEAEPAIEKKSKAKKVASENDDNEEKIPDKSNAAEKNAKKSGKKVSKEDQEEPSNKKKRGKEAEPADEKKSKAKKVAAENEDNEEEIPNKADPAKKNAKKSDKKDDQEEPSDKKKKGKEAEPAGGGGPKLRRATKHVEQASDGEQVDPDKMSAEERRKLKAMPAKTTQAHRLRFVQKTLKENPVARFYLPFGKDARPKFKVRKPISYKQLHLEDLPNIHLVRRACYRMTARKQAKESKSSKEKAPKTGHQSTLQLILHTLY